MTLRIGVIGAGGIADIILSSLAEHLPAKFRFLSVFNSSGRPISPIIAENARRISEQFAVRTAFDEFLLDSPEIVVECASHEAVRQFAGRVLESGSDLFLASTSALADDELRTGLQKIASRSGAKLVLAAGALGAIDVLSAARLAGILSASYTGRKPPRAWIDTPAERLIDLSAVSKPTTFFQGSAREAARAYPQNANVAATLALAGAGFDRTNVTLVADPTIRHNCHELDVHSACVNFSISIEGVPSSSNPKTSRTAGFSLAHQVLNRVCSIAF